MKETALWNQLRPRLALLGKFQKISDRFTPGVPDVLGIYQGKGIALELKEFAGAHVLKVKFRPGQVDWLTEWAECGGRAWVGATTSDRTFYLIGTDHLDKIAEGVSPTKLRDISTFYSKGPKWELVVNAIVSS